MKAFNQLLFIAVFIAFCGCNNPSQKKPSRYTDYDRGYQFLFDNKYDSAFSMFSSYVENPDDTLKKGIAYRYMAEMLWKIGELYSAQEYLVNGINTLDSLDEKHQEELGIAYNIKGNVSLDLRLYDEAINSYNKAMTFFKGSDYLAEIMNGKAVALQRKKDYKNAIAMYDSIPITKLDDQSLVARIIHNRARTKWLQDTGYRALPEFWAALKIRVDSQYNVGLNTSYGHLSDYYATLKPDSALWYAQKMLEKAKDNKSPSDILAATDRLITLSNASAFKKYWNEFKILSDSLQHSKDTAQNRFAFIRYDFKKSNADNLRLQQHITVQRLLMYALIALVVVIISGLSYWFGKHGKRIKEESETAIRNARLKTSQKVHDVVANGLYRIMNELEYGKSVDKEPLINKIEGLYQKSRNISYEDTDPAGGAGYDAQVHDLLTSFANEQTKVIVVGNQPAFWNQVTPAQKQQLQLVLNELMVNMKKHSKAKNVGIVFKQEDSKGFIMYKDDGAGFSPGFEYGNGLKNTVSRIKSLNGEVNFGESGPGGASIAISFPFQSSQT